MVERGRQLGSLVLRRYIGERHCARPDLEMKSAIDYGRATNLTAIDRPRAFRGSYDSRVKDDHLAFNSNR